MLRWIKSLFAWRTIERMGVWVYRENAVTGQRKAIHVGGALFGPIRGDGWLRHGDIVVSPFGSYRIGSEAEKWHV